MLMGMKRSSSQYILTLSDYFNTCSSRSDLRTAFEVAFTSNSPPVAPLP
jgi:hypothetical protein